MNERTRARPSRADRPARSIGRYVRSDAVAIIIAIASVLVVGLVVLAGPGPRRATSRSPTPASTTSPSSSPPARAGRGSRSPSSGQRSTRQFQDVLDQGDTWVFAFRSQGHDGGEITLSRAELAAAGWNSPSPTRVIEQFRQHGAPPSPCIAADCPPSSG